MSLPRLLIGILMSLLCYTIQAQESSLRQQTFKATLDTLKLDTLSIYPYSFKIICSEKILPREDYYLDHSAARFKLHKKCGDSITVEYRVLPFDLSKEYSRRNSNIIFRQGLPDERDKFRIENTYSVEDVFGGSSLNKSGSISRGVSFGNNQDIGINSTLNLELSGEIAPNLKLLASVSDDNLPIQPDGNTSKLQEFDQVFIQIYNDRLKLVAGDFWIYRPKGYFMNYKKRAQGLNINYQWGKDSLNVWKTELSGALSRGKFHRQIIQGVEGNQGPYRLRGAENEPFIIILAGTERVYIDGRLLERGQEMDYTINYNTSELVFTSRNLITKDSRIVVEFQYTDQNYARSLVQSSTTYSSEKISFWFNAYSEQDAKNQTLQQELSLSQKQLLSSIGDSLELATTNSIDSVGWFENQVLYKMIDSLGYDSVLVFSVNPDSAFFRATFTYVGPGKGNYIFSNSNALGKVFQWVAPVSGLPQGDYIPSRLIITAQQRRMVSSGARYRLRKNLFIETELAYSGYDKNTFSRIDGEDDSGIANRTKLLGTLPLGKNTDSLHSWELDTKAELEYLDRFFNPIEQYRSVEFDRDWNTRNKGYKGKQLYSTAGVNLKNKSAGNINLEGQFYSIGNDYQGIRAATDGKWNKNGFRARWDGSYLSSSTVEQNEFIRHRAELSKDFKWFKVGYIDDHELNRFKSSSMSLDIGSYQFFDYQFYIANGDSVKNMFKLFYRERYDQFSDSSTLVPAAKARTSGGEFRISELKNQSLNIITAYRELKIIDPSLINLPPENTVTGRIDHEIRVWKNALTWTNFYEVGSGLEQKREFLYIQVNDGQGVYTWIDYNGDGVKDLNEFELAQFVDQASYIRVFTPSSEYQKTYSNELNESVFWRPERIWSNKKGILGVLSRFSNQARIRINRKTNLFNGIEAFNPFASQIRDTNLISSTYNLRNTLFFNRTSSIFSAEYNFQDLRSKTLLASGFDSRANLYHELSFRWNIKRVFSIEAKGQKGTKDSEADYTSGRNYSLAYYFIQPSLIFQPGTSFRVSLDVRYSEKENAPVYGGENAILREIGTTFKYNQAEKGSLQGGIKMVNIAYYGNANSALGFEILEALKPGINYTWNIGYQRSVSRNLQLSIQYNGRRSENSRTIHSGGMELRAFF
jgi:hypothetical protein